MASERPKAEQLALEALECDSKRLSEVVEWMTDEGIPDLEAYRTLVRMLSRDEIVVYEEKGQRTTIHDPELALPYEPEVRAELGHDKIPLLTNERIKELGKAYLDARLEGSEKRIDYAKQDIFTAVMEAAYGKNFWKLSNRI